MPTATEPLGVPTVRLTVELPVVCVVDTSPDFMLELVSVVVLDESLKPMVLPVSEGTATKPELV
jgi:hypothetical protein